MFYYQVGDEANMRLWLDRVVEHYESGGYYSESYIAFHFAQLGDFDNALLWCQTALEAQDLNLAWPEFFYTPERYSNRQDWLEFWQHPKLSALITIRKNHGIRENVGWWKNPAKNH